MTCAECDHLPGECESCETQINPDTVYRRRWETLKKSIEKNNTSMRREFLLRLIKIIEEEIH